MASTWSHRKAKHAVECEPDDDDEVEAKPEGEPASDAEMDGGDNEAAEEPEDQGHEVCVRFISNNNITLTLPGRK